MKNEIGLTKEEKMLFFSIPSVLFIMGHIAEITAAVGALSMIIVFSKFSTYGGTQPF